MKQKLYETKKQLKIEYMLNSKEIKKLNEKIKILNKNFIEGKFLIFAQSFAVSFPVLIVLSIVVATISPNFIGSIISTEPLRMIRRLLLGSIISGVIAERTISKVNHKKLNKFSGAKTDEQKREEILEYALQKQKLDDKNKAINVAYDFACDLETRLDVCNLDFGNSNMSKEEQEKNNKNLRENIKVKENELEILSTQHFLNNNFVMLRSKMGKLATIGTPFVIGLTTSMIAVVGVMTFKPDILMETLPQAGKMMSNIALAGGTIGAAISSVQTYLVNKQDRRIFNKFNNKLGEDKLPENVDSDIKEARKIVSKGDKVINELATAHLVYQDSTRELESISSEIVANEETTLDIVIKGAKTFDKLNLMSESDERTETIMQVAHDDEIKEVEGPTLVKRK